MSLSPILEFPNKNETPPINKTRFWSDDPNVILQKEYVFELFPSESMSYEQKLNAVSRLVILITIVTFILTHSFRILIISAITLFSIFILYFYQEKEKSKLAKKKEGFKDAGIEYLSQNDIPISPDTFTPPNSTNPFGNVLVPDYTYNTNKKPAPPAYNTAVNQDILSQAKQLVVDLNPDQPDIADKLFKDLGDQYMFEQSMQPFNSNSSTTIPNDQGAFADFCYGSMVSCKEGNLFACARNLSRHIN